MSRIAAFVVIAVAVASCGSPPATDGTWVLRTGRVDGEPIPLIPSHPITMTVDGDELDGTAACNTYRALSRISGDAITILDLAITEMACLPPEVMDSEARFLDALADATTIESSPGRLVLRGPRSELVFEAGSP